MDLTLKTVVKLCKYCRKLQKYCILHKIDAIFALLHQKTVYDKSIIKSL